MEGELQFAYSLVSEEAIRRCSSKNAFLKISQYSQKNTCVRVSFYCKETPAQVFSCEYSEIFKNRFFYRTPPVASSVVCILTLKWLSQEEKVLFEANNYGGTFANRVMCVDSD